MGSNVLVWHIRARNPTRKLRKSWVSTSRICVAPLSKHWRREVLLEPHTIWSWVSSRSRGRFHWAAFDYVALTVSAVRSVLDQVAEDLRPLTAKVKGKRERVKQYFRHADITSEISGFKEKIQNALSVLQVQMCFYLYVRPIAHFNGRQLEIDTVTVCTVNDIKQAQTVMREAQIVGTNSRNRSDS